MEKEKQTPVLPTVGGHDWETVHPTRVPKGSTLTFGESGNYPGSKNASVNHTRAPLRQASLATAQGQITDMAAKAGGLEMTAMLLELAAKAGGLDFFVANLFPIIEGERVEDFFAAFIAHANAGEIPVPAFGISAVGWHGAIVPFHAVPLWFCILSLRIATSPSAKEPKRSQQQTYRISARGSDPYISTAPTYGSSGMCLTRVRTLLPLAVHLRSWLST